MSNRCLRPSVVGIVATIAWSAAFSGDWVIVTPMNPTTYHHDDDVNTSGVATSHPTSRRVSFGYKDAMGLHPEQTVTTSSQDVGGGMYNWECTLLAPTNPPENGWQLSPVQEGEVIPDHVIWEYSTSTQDIDDKSEDHKVIQ